MVVKSTKKNPNILQKRNWIFLCFAGKISLAHLLELYFKMVEEGRYKEFKGDTIKHKHQRLHPADKVLFWMAILVGKLKGHMRWTWERRLFCNRTFFLGGGGDF